ncbi:MAG: ring-cleaving dioxygenase, partial [Bacteroidetes bacterium]|nr:ring-cleaving dioxygenase [Bacteroidota bacterium]
IGYSVPAGSLAFWEKRLQDNNVIYNKTAEKFGEQYLTFLDPDGLKFELTVSKTADNRTPWTTADISAENAIRGFHHITITANKAEPTAYILTKVFGYRLLTQDGNRYRYITDAIDTANIVDIVELPQEGIGHVAGGSVHHVAFRVENEAVLMEYREKIAALGLHITEKIDRNYFYSLYFREPGGVLFEIATDNPGFGVDEKAEDLGKGLKLPAQYESHRKEIEAVLPKLD